MDYFTVSRLRTTMIVLKKRKLLVSVNEDVEGADTVEERQEGNASSDLANDITNFLTNFFLVLKF